MKKNIFTICFAMATMFMFGQEITPETDNVESQFMEQLIQFPHEKIYVQTDKSTYLSGERIWLRSHLIDAASNRPVFISRYVYLELFNPFNELIKRIKIRPDSIGVYSGHMDLDEDLAEGNYTLRAYTRYMRNQGNESFFKKNIEVLDPHSLKIEPIPNFEISNNRVNVNFQFVNRTSGDTIAPDIVTFKLSDETTRTISPKNRTNFNWSFILTKKRNNRNILLGIVHEGRKYSRFYAIPYSSDDFDVTFHPEGGYLIPGKTCRVGFKAINPSGLSEDVTGIVYNSQNSGVAKFTTHKLGMGSFHIHVEPGEQYYAICETKNGASKRIDLPIAESQAKTISIKHSGDKITVSVLKGETSDNDPLSLLVHNKGFVIYHKPWSPETDRYLFPTSAFPTGIISFILLNANNEIVSERLFFNNGKDDFAKLQTDLSATKYKTREQIAIALKLADADTVSYYNNLAISVIDKNSAIPDTTNSLISTLLLSSELKGHIESPASYFTGNKSDQLALDALLMTQGWRRYDIPKVLKGEISTPDNFKPEEFQEISGKTEALLISMKDGEISLMATLDTLISAEKVTADENGRFLFKVEYPEGTEITVQSLSKKGGKRNLINIDPVTFPDSSLATIPMRGLESPKTNFDLDAYLKKANEEYSLKHGIRSIMLEEVTVTAQKKQTYTESKFYSPITSSSLITSDEIEKRKVSSFYSLLTSTPGLIVRSDRVTTTRSDMPVLFVIDDMTYEDFFDRINDIDISSIDNMFIMKDNTFMLGYYPNTSGAVVVTTKGGFVQKNVMSKNIDRIIPLGYQQPAEFYSPKYETAKEIESPSPDLRTTIFWKPDVEFSKSGEAIVEFYAADSPTTYLIIGEGVTGLGKIIHFTEEVEIEAR